MLEDSNAIMALPAGLGPNFAVGFAGLGRTGLAIARPARRLLVDDELFERLSASTYARQFTWSKSIQPLRKILQQLYRTTPAP
jgi:hypothetical protein